MKLILQLAELRASCKSSCISVPESSQLRARFHPIELQFELRASGAAGCDVSRRVAHHTRLVKDVWCNSTRIMKPTITTIYELRRTRTNG